MTSRKGGKPETWSRPTGTEAEGKVSEVSRGPGTWNPTVPQESIEQIASFCPAGAVVHGQLCPTGAPFRGRLLSGPRILLDVRAVAWVSKGRGTSGWHNVSPSGPRSDPAAVASFVPLGSASSRNSPSQPHCPLLAIALPFPVEIRTRFCVTLPEEAPTVPARRPFPAQEQDDFEHAPGISRLLAFFLTDARIAMVRRQSGHYLMSPPNLELFPGR